MSGLHKSPIEWCDFTANPIRGKRPHFGTPRCGTYYYAEAMRKRFGGSDKLSFHPEVLAAIARRKNPATIFMGSMIDLFADEIPGDWIEGVMEHSKQHTFIVLSKHPDRMTEMLFEEVKAPIPKKAIDFLSNVWWGISMTHEGQYTQGELNSFQLIPRRFISFEPLLGPVESFPACPGYIIGAQTGPGAVIPKRKWVDDIIRQADLFGSKVFVKNNMLAHFPDLSNRRDLAWRLYTK